MSIMVKLTQTPMIDVRDVPFEAVMFKPEMSLQLSPDRALLSQNKKRYYDQLCSHYTLLGIVLALQAFPCAANIIIQTKNGTCTVSGTIFTATKDLVEHLKEEIVPNIEQCFVLFAERNERSHFTLQFTQKAYILKVAR